MPLGIPNWYHRARNLPSWSKIWMRAFDRSHTNSRPRLSMLMQCGTWNSPGPYPVFPQALTNFPSFEYFTMRLLVKWPSATKMSPLGAVTTPAGDLKWYSSSPPTPGSPSVISSCPSGLNLRTTWPALTPALAAVATAASAPESVAHTLPSRSTWRPCGQMNIWAPKLFTTLPLGSNLKIVSCGLSVPSGFIQSMPKRPPRATGTGLVSSQRMKAQMLSPSTSTCTEAGGPISRPPGSLAHSPPGMLGPPPSANPLTGRYGLSVGPWAKHSVASSTATPHNTILPKRIAFDMTPSLGQFLVGGADATAHFMTRAGGFEPTGSAPSP